jgi:hypothetical protein
MPKLWITGEKLWITRAYCGEPEQLFELCTPRYGGMNKASPKCGLSKFNPRISCPVFSFFHIARKSLLVTKPPYAGKTGTDRPPVDAAGVFSTFPQALLLLLRFIIFTNTA